MMKLKNVLRSGAVIRYHSTMIDKKQTNAEHQWEVGVILGQIYPKLTTNLLLYALVHDGAESITGDIPAPMKLNHPAIKALFDELEKEYMRTELDIPDPCFSEEDLLAVKHADVLSGVYFTNRRVNAGDKEAIPIRDKWIQYWESLPFLNNHSVRAMEEILK